ncbi:hypothetical protein MINT15_19250 [Saccharomonospora viridis]|uniref:Uncharacterized protein n=1 Tax=Saccharomonospora viridis TaxID=1852 RepID=A0A837DB31_9PSEU|nr:hypothetical protein MINT15_19250 [Saccharomonospora viridis]
MSSVPRTGLDVSHGFPGYLALCGFFVNRVRRPLPLRRLVRHHGRRASDRQSFPVRALGGRGGDRTNRPVASTAYPLLIAFV